jgi:predicted Zn-ribbon and HTH transcriptional regulator
MTQIIDRTCRHGICEHRGQYVVEARCTNCGWDGRLRTTMGHEAWKMANRAECPRCGCRSIKAGAFVESTEG